MSKKITDLDPIGSLELTDLCEVVGDPGGTNLSRKATMQQVADVVSTDTDIADAISKKHTAGGDTTLGAMTADVNMNSHKLTGLSAPSSNGDSIRATTIITEAALEAAISGGSGGDVATDAIWDAAGDLAVGTGADTAVKVNIGAEELVARIGAGNIAGISVAEQTIVGRKTGGSIDDLSATDARTILGLATTDSPVFVTAKLSGLADGKIPYHVDDATGLADGPTKTDVDSAVSLKHTAGGDTTLGALAADVNMNSHKLTGLSVPASNGDSIRATTKITEALLESATDLKHSQNTDTIIVVTAAPGSDLAATGNITTGTAGEALAFGNLCYMKSDGKWWKAKADAVGTMPGMAMAIASISADASGNFLILGIARDDSWAWTVGGIIYASSATAGALTQTAPSTATHYVQPIGIATHADRMLFNPDLAMVKVK